MYFFMNILNGLTRYVLPVLAFLLTENANDGATDRLVNTCPYYAKIRWLLVESRGGTTRARILLLLRNRPTNANKIATELGLDYKTVRQHLELLEKNGLVSRLGNKYGDVYFLPDIVYKHWNELEELIRESLKLGNMNQNRDSRA